MKFHLKDHIFFLLKPPVLRGLVRGWLLFFSPYPIMLLTSLLAQCKNLHCMILANRGDSWLSGLVGREVREGWGGCFRNCQQEARRYWSSQSTSGCWIQYSHFRGAGWNLWGTLVCRHTCTLCTVPAGSTFLAVLDNIQSEILCQHGECCHSLSAWSYRTVTQLDSG